MPEPSSLTARSHPARSWLFVPGANERFVAKLPETRPDAVVFDLEDGVAEAELAAARERIGRSLSAAADQRIWLPRVVALRSHPAAHPDFAADLSAAGPRLDVLILPKVASAADVAEAAAALAAADLPSAGVVPLIESAAGLARLDEILAHRTVVGVAFGGEDFAADLGLPPETARAGVADDGVQEHDPGTTAARHLVLDHARVRIVTAAAALGLSCRIDTPLLQIRPFELAEAAARRSRALGFSGKLVIHPAHVEPVHTGFRPGATEVSWARRVLGLDTAKVSEPPAVFASSERSGAGAISVEGRMVDEAVLRQARATLAAAGEE